MPAIIELFKKHEIAEIAIIDDFFDPPKVETDGASEKIASFWSEIVEDKDALFELKTLGFDVRSREEIGNDLLKVLWDNRTKLKSLERPSGHIFSIKNEESELVKFLALIEKDYGIKYKPFGTDDALTDPKYKLIFIDYYLGPISSEALKIKAVNRSIYFAEKLLETYESEPHKPVFILMSSLPISEEMRNNFRDRAKIMGGMFYFISKNNIAEKRRLAIELYPIMRGLEASYKIDSFITSLKDSMDSARNVFEGQINSLSISDYAYIQKLCLEDEEHPLGNYVLWLFGEHYIHLLSEALRDQRKAINNISIDDLPPSQFIPSLVLAEIYNSALFENVSDADELQFGDIFVKDKDVRIVINPECSLVRDVDGDLSIILLHGELVEHSKSDPKKTAPNIRTEMFQLEIEDAKKSFRIAWYLNRFDSFKYKEVKAIVKDRGFEKVFRLKLPNALQIQNAFSSNLTRVGINVAPPIYSPLKVEVFCEGTDGKAEQLLPLGDNLAYLFFVKRQDKCALKSDFIYNLIEKLPEAISKLDQQIKQSQAMPEKMSELTRKKSTLERLYDTDSEIYKLLVEPIPVPAVNGKLEHSYFLITRGLTDLTGKKYRSEKCPLWLNIIDQ
jgi:hypothetical protein